MIRAKRRKREKVDSGTAFTVDLFWLKRHNQSVIISDHFSGWGSSISVFHVFTVVERTWFANLKRLSSATCYTANESGSIQSCRSNADDRPDRYLDDGSRSTVLATVGGTASTVSGCRSGKRFDLPTGHISRLIGKLPKWSS